MWAASSARPGLMRSGETRCWETPSWRQIQPTWVGCLSLLDNRFLQGNVCMYVPRADGCWPPVSTHEVDGFEKHSLSVCSFLLWHFYFSTRSSPGARFAQRCCFRYHRHSLRPAKPKVPPGVPSCAAGFYSCEIPAETQQHPGNSDMNTRGPALSPTSRNAVPVDTQTGIQVPDAAHQGWTGR